MKKLFLLSVLLFLGACAYVDPSITDQTQIITDAKVRRSELVVAVAPKAKSYRPLTALCYPFHVQQPTPDYRHIGKTFANIFYGEWMRKRLFPTMEFDDTLVYYGKRRALAEARKRGADLLVLGFIPYFYAGSTLDDTALTIQSNIYDAKTGILLFSMAQSGRIEERMDEDWIYFKHRTRMSDSPFTKLITSIAADMAIPLQSWLPAPDTPYNFASNRNQIVSALTNDPAAMGAQGGAAGSMNGSGADGGSGGSGGTGTNGTNSAMGSGDSGSGAIERDLSQTGREIPGVNLDIRFDVDKATIRPESYPLLDELGDALNSPKLKGKRIIVAGHTDSTANDRYNLTLSMARAESVKKYLVMKHSILPNLIETVGYGESRPVADNRTDAGKQKNRRVEIRLAE